MGAEKKDICNVALFRQNWYKIHSLSTVIALPGNSDQRKRPARPETVRLKSTDLRPISCPTIKFSPLFSAFSQTRRNERTASTISGRWYFLDWGVLQHPEVQEDKNQYPDAAPCSIFSAQGTITPSQNFISGKNGLYPCKRSYLFCFVFHAASQLNRPTQCFFNV